MSAPNSRHITETPGERVTPSVSPPLPAAPPSVAQPEGQRTLGVQIVLGVWLGVFLLLWLQLLSEGVRDAIRGLRSLFGL